VDCQNRVPHIQKPFCERCGIPTTSADICHECKTVPPPYQMMRSWAVFDSPVQNALHTLKYRGNVSMGDVLAVQMKKFVISLDWHVDVIAPVPLGKKRLKERGYNQAGMVARALAYEIGLEYAPQALWKSRETRSQVGLSLSQRWENVREAYQADPESVKRKSILLIDDVATTGSTIQACSNALLSGGAREVYAVTIARALSHHDLTRV